MRSPVHIIFGFVLCFADNVFSQTANIDFELTPVGTYTAANAVSGWTVSSRINKTTGYCTPTTTWAPGSPEFSIVSTPIVGFPMTGVIPHSPLGGSHVARLNNLVADTTAIRISRTYSVSSSLSVLKLAYAGVWQDGGPGHLWFCEQPHFKIELKDQLGNPLTCLGLTMAPGLGNQSPGMTFTINPINYFWSNWQVKYFDLTPFIGNVITIEMVSSDCARGDHYGTVFLDAVLESPYMTVPNCVLTFTPSPVNLCSGSGIAKITAPPGYGAYQWYGPGNIPIAAPQGTMSSLITTSVTPGTVFTVSLTHASGCQSFLTYTIGNTQVNIVGLGNGPSCLAGATGSAAVVANGSAFGYNYSWISSSNAVVSTSSLVSGLPPGVYTVNVQSAGTTSLTCGTSSAVVTITTSPQNLTILSKPYCGAEAYLGAPPGINHQWYSGTTSISSGLGGTAPSYTVSSPVQGSIYNLGYTSFFGCRDSIQYFLLSSIPGSLNLSSNPPICQNGTNGTVVFSMTPASGTSFGQNYYVLSSTGTTSAYSASLYPAYSNVFTASGLLAGGTYSIAAFDGSCKYSMNFSVTPLTFSYSLSPSSTTLCPGGSAAIAVSFSNPAMFSHYTYSWSPTNYLFGANASNAIITPPSSTGNTTTLIYTVVVTPTILSCPISKTISITSIPLPQTPTVLPIPNLCTSSPPYTITANPPGGLFLNNSAVTSLGVIKTSVASSGIHTFIYTNAVGSCSSITSATFLVQSPSLSIAGNSTLFCGQSTTLNASGADTYLWNNTQSGFSLVVSPAYTSVYSVVGTNTTNMCIKTQLFQVSVTSSLVISVSGNSTVCRFQPTTLTATGAQTYTWSNYLTSSSIVVTPTSNVSYSLQAQDVFGCKASTTFSLKVLPVPVLSVHGPQTICAGDMSYVNLIGAQNYSLNNVPSYFVAMLSPTITTTYTIRGENTNGCQDTLILKMNVLPCTDINEFTGSESMNIYPNPTSGKLFFETQKFVSLTLTDQLGKKIPEIQFDPGLHNIDLSGYPAGIYFLSIKVGDLPKTIKLIKTE